MAKFRTSFMSKTLSRVVDFSVVIPIEYTAEEDAGKKFKTTVLLPGFHGSHNDWLEYGRIRKISEVYHLAMIIVNGENSFYIDSPAYPYGRFVRETIEFSRSVFPLSDRREDSFIGGVSMGGFGALRLGALYHDMFSKVFSLSGAFILDDLKGSKVGYRDRITDYETYHRIFGDFDHIKGTVKDPLWCVDQAVLAGEAPAVYQVCGDKDFLIEQNRTMARELAKRPILHEYHEPHGAVHSWGEWLKMLDDVMQWLCE